MPDKYTDSERMAKARQLGLDNLSSESQFMIFKKLETFDPLEVSNACYGRGLDGALDFLLARDARFKRCSMPSPDLLAESLSIATDATSPHPPRRAAATARLKMEHLVALADELRRKDEIIESLRQERIRAWDAARKEPTEG